MLESKNDTDNILEEIIPNAFTFKMVKVEGGTFRFGANSSATEGEKTISKVTVPDFYISPYTVTNAEFAVFLNEAYNLNKIDEDDWFKQRKKIKQISNVIKEGKSGIRQKGNFWIPAKGFEMNPVIRVSWEGAIEYCNWLKEKTGNSYRLPTESEWEYVARGGNKSLSFQYAGSNRLKEVGWYELNSYEQTKPVGLKLPNEIGLYDMSGNVWEWCGDIWHKEGGNILIEDSQYSSMKNENRYVVRGGCWLSHEDKCNLYTREGYEGKDWSDYFGFRVARN